MSDYAGAIGSVLSIVGMATGQVWLTAIGMGISAWGASQQVIPGPKIGDVQQQTSQEGGFRPIIYGRSHPIMGNIIADGGPVIVTRQERQGKGGPKVESESAFRTYAVGFCEGESSLLQVWRNGILVYDAENPGMAAENAKFLEYATWFTGALDQPVSADLEEVYGAGNTPYFRGTSYLVLHNEDVTDQRGAWSRWQVRVFRSAAKSYTTPPYPIIVRDDMGITAALIGGVTLESPVDLMNITAAPLGGDITEPLKPYFAPPESMDIAAQPLGGSIFEPLQQYVWPPEEMEVTAQPLGGDVETVLVRYENYDPESMNITAAPLGGEIT